MRKHLHCTLSESSLVQLTDSPDLKIDIRYATDNNVLGKAFYRSNLCYVHKDLAKFIKDAVHELSKQNLGLVIWDGYRHPACQEILFEKFPIPHFVTPPYDIQKQTNGSNHSRGTTIDVTLFDKKSGELLEMPTLFDDFSDKAYLDYEGDDLSDEARRNRKTLRAVMEKIGLATCPEEWWEYGLPHAKDYPILFIDELGPL